MFAKLFAIIYDSSIAEDWKTRIVFQDMLILADKNGIIDMTPEAIARRTNIPLEMVLEAIPKLEASDSLSRTPDHEGRRILRVDAHRPWGWRIVNFVKYRESATKEMLRMAEADRKREYRARHSRNPSPIPPTHTEERQRQTSPGTCPGQDREVGPIPPIKKRAGWQLLRDEKALSDRIRQESESVNPDRKLIESLKSQRKATRDEMKA